MSYQVSLGQSLKKMMQSELGKQKSLYTNDKSIFTNDISLILDRGPMIGYICSHAPPCIAPILTLYKNKLAAFQKPPMG